MPGWPPRRPKGSVAEYLTYVASTGDSSESIEMRYEDENIWLTQKMLATLYDVSVPAISQHIKRIYDDGELLPEATIKKYLIVQNEGGRQISRNIDHYNLQMIIAVGFKVNNQRAVRKLLPLAAFLCCKERGEHVGGWA